MKSNHSLFTMLQQCLDALLARDTHWFTRVIGLAALPLLALLIPLMTVLVCPERLTIVAAGVVAVLNAPSWTMILGLIAVGYVLANVVIRQ